MRMHTLRIVHTTYSVEAYLNVTHPWCLLESSELRVLTT